MVASPLFSLGVSPVNADCNMPGTRHDDNHPSDKKGNEMIKSGASACEVAKACDAMKIDVSIQDKKELHQTEMYKSAPDDVKKELDEYATHGHGHDNPNLTCYEVEYAVKE